MIINCHSRLLFSLWEPAFLHSLALLEQFKNAPETGESEDSDERGPQSALYEQ